MTDYHFWCQTTGRKFTRKLTYCALALVQAPFGYVFWLIEQRKAQIQDRLEREGGAQ